MTSTSEVGADQDGEQPSPTTPDATVPEPETLKKKKKKKSKKNGANKALANANGANGAKPAQAEEPKPTVLCISRNKHWKYISSYHGPWLQLPVELLESLLLINMDPASITITESKLSPPLGSPTTQAPSSPLSSLLRLKGSGSNNPDYSQTTDPPPSPFPLFKSGQPIPPPIDPGVFASVTTVRRLIDEASDLAVRAASGLSAAALGSLRNNNAYGFGNGGNPWGASSAYGYGASGDMGGGRNVAMSAMRVHRLRALAIQRLAAAYKADEIAASVMVMQGASALDDIAERVLKVDPNDPDARYVHFFHEKIPSRQLAECTTTKVLDDLIAAYPQRLEYYRTRGVVHSFRDEYPAAIRDFGYALKEARAIRKSKQAHLHTVSNGQQVEHRPHKNKKGKKGARGKGHSSNKHEDSAPHNGEDQDAEPSSPTGTSIPSTPTDPIEPQVLFLRGAAYLQNVFYIVENRILQLEGVTKGMSADGPDMKLCCIETGHYGGVELGNPEGPLGHSHGSKALAYQSSLDEPRFKEQIFTYLRKSVRDHERFLSHFKTLESSPQPFPGDIATQVEHAFLLSDAMRSGNPLSSPPPTSSSPSFTTYHPLLVESHFSILICILLLGNFTDSLPAFVNAVALVERLEGYPIFLPARSMSQAEFLEVLERLAKGWKTGIMPHPKSTKRLALEPAPVPSEVASGSGQQEEARENMASTSSLADAPSSSESEMPDAEQTRRRDLSQSLDSLRILLAPVHRRQRERAEKIASEKANGNDGQKQPQINIPLHGPRVEIILAWLAAVHLPGLESVA
ncbi:hypothetical protein SISNIDRAFT_411316 [Sistotremastrum niveocremeum HHB9708]|uniref:Uncharacterized protein n=1 Tax=Sistotremastrum niveocremeum HHB9708 TaxID=1314777 RepID=A0A164UT34_9AGAM|nr:hypothetical protein SISNIDRAFT_411316 [Sistotremastrum niveocremeum HHB9708]